MCGLSLKFIRNNRSMAGFTIVELLIVIVVIAILASISVVAYNGIQSRANIAKINSDLLTINKAIQMYYAENGSYPDNSNTWRGYRAYGAHGQDFVPGIQNIYVSTVPSPSALSSTSDYLYRSTGTNYKLIAHNNNVADGFQVLCPQAVQMNPSMADPSRNCWAWGYFTSGAASF